MLAVTWEKFLLEYSLNNLDKIQDFTILNLECF